MTLKGLPSAEICQWLEQRACIYYICYIDYLHVPQRWPLMNFALIHSFKNASMLISLLCRFPPTMQSGVADYIESTAREQCGDSVYILTGMCRFWQKGPIEKCMLLFRGTTGRSSVLGRREQKRSSQSLLCPPGAACQVVMD